jgi:hypothetical protein
MSYTAEYAEAQAATERGQAERAFRDRLQTLEERLHTPGYEVGQVDTIEVEQLAADIAGSEFTLDGLRERADALVEYARDTRASQERLAELRDRREALETQVAKMEKRRQTLPAISWIALGAWGGFGAFGTAGWFLGGSAYDRYMDATTLEDIEAEKRRFQTWDALTYASYGVGGAGAVTFAVIRLFVPSRTKLERTKTQLAEAAAEISSIEAALESRE